MCDTLAQLALEMVCKQLAVAVSRYSPTQHGVLYLTTASPRLRHVALHGTFLPPMSGDVGCLKFHNPLTDAALLRRCRPAGDLGLKSSTRPAMQSEFVTLYVTLASQ